MIELHGLGYRMRPHDPRERQYRLPAPAVAIDLTQRRSLAAWRPRIEHQGSIGSCVAQAVTSALELLATKQGRSPRPETSRLWMYYEARRKQGWQGQDTGSYPADALDIARDLGVPKEDLWPYDVAQFAVDPPDAVDADAPNQKWTLTHHPIYPMTDGVGGIWQALDAGYPVVVGMDWLTLFDADKPAGMLPPGGRGGDPSRGGHAVYCWGIAPPNFAHLGLLLCSNSWGEAWNPQASSGDAEMRPGDFGIPWEYVQNGVVYELRAVDPAPFTPPVTDWSQVAIDAIRLGSRALNVVDASMVQKIVAQNYDGVVDDYNAVLVALGLSPAWTRA